MISCRGRIQVTLACGLLSIVPTQLHAQTPIGSFLVPLNSSKKELPPASEWSKELLAKVNSTWTESNVIERDRKLHELAEQAPAQLAYITRVFQQKNEVQTTTTVNAVKELFGVLRRVSWQPADVPHVQRIVASWSVVAPQLVKLIPSSDISANQRRILEQALLDLAYLSRDSVIGTPLAQQTWQSQVQPLAQLTGHSKTSVKLVALSVLEVIGTDAQPASSAVITSLLDKDCFVRWTAVRCLSAMGLDQESIREVAKLQNDEDAQVRQLAISVVSSNSKGTVNLAQARDAKPRLPLIQQAAEKDTAKTVTPEVPPVKIVTNDAIVGTMKAPETPAHLNKTREINADTISMKPDQRATPAVLPSALPVQPLQLPPVKTKVPGNDPAPLFGAVETKPTPSLNLEVMPKTSATTIEPVVRNSAAVPALPSTETIRQNEPAVNFTGSVGKEVATKAPPPVPPLMTNIPVLPPATLQSSNESMSVPKTSAAPLPTPIKTTVPPGPVKNAVKSSARQPAMGIQPVAAVAQSKPNTRPSQVNLWMPRLKQGTVDQQVQAVRELGKLGAGAADAVPLLAETLIKGDVAVRREIPLTLIKIGAPAKLATAVLERCLQDSDTDVKVNAARALLELAE